MHNEMKGIDVAGNNMDRPQMYYAKGKKPDSTGYLLCGPIYKTLSEGQNFRDCKSIE